jgi:signal transduction histidine kinase
VPESGKGIEPGGALRGHILRRGVRADEAVPGSGLGLAIVRDLAELYGGSISLESWPTGGLRARLQLPAC